VVILPITKIINTELSIDRMADLYKGETRIRVVANEGWHSLIGGARICCTDLHKTNLPG